MYLIDIVLGSTMAGYILRLLFILVLFCFDSLTAAPRTIQINSTLNTDINILAAGYPVEIHQVITSDGYILHMHRIPYGRNETACAATKAPVFLMHGLTGASSAWIFNDDQSPAYNLADAGFDVWMGNARGNKDSRFHVSLNPDDEVEKFTFFDFTWEEIGLIDLPVMIDYVLETTGYEKLHYIGHSQGGTVFLVLNSMLTEYNAKFASAHLMAGVGYMEYFPDQELVGFAAFTNIIYAFALELGFVELFPPGFNISDISDLVPFPRHAYDCDVGLGVRGICDVVGVQQLLQRDDATNATEDELIFDLDSLGGAAIKQYAHYGQNVASKLFARWDYGTATNLEVYGSEMPPLYDISLVTVATTMHYTVSDNLLDERDVLAMAADMPNTVVRRVARDTFTHSDFVIASDAKELVTDYIIEALTAFGNEEAVTDSEDVGDIDEVVDIDDNNNTNSSSMLGVGVLLNVYLLGVILRLSW